MSDFAAKNIHKSGYLKKNIVRAKANLKIAVILGPCCLAAGLGLGFLGLLIGLPGVLIGIAVFLSGFAVLGWEEFNTPRVKFLDDILYVIKSHEVVYLHDDCFEDTSAT